MGTRNLTMVIDQEGEVRVAQYGQWDGYPSGVGAGVLQFLKDKELFDKFKSNLPKVRFVEEEGRDKDMLESYNKNAPEWSSDPDNRTEEQKRWFSSYISRDLADEILVNIAESEDAEIIISDKRDFAGNSLSCEWAYVIDLKNEVFEIYEGYNKNPLSEEDRFYSLTREGEKYYPVKKIHEYKLSDLPEENEFVSEIGRIESEE